MIMTGIRILANFVRISRMMNPIIIKVTTILSGTAAQQQAAWLLLLSS